MLELEVEALVSLFAEPEILEYLWHNNPSNLSNILSLKYTGETRRNLKTRMTEHKGAVHRGDERNGIAVHVHQLQHGIDWESARVWMTARGYWNKRTLEAIQIRREHHTMNLDCGFHISPVWNPLLDATELT